MSWLPCQIHGWLLFLDFRNRLRNKIVSDFLVVASVLAVVVVKHGTKSETHQRAHIPEVLQPCCVLVCILCYSFV
jgi:hypothetical protein